MKAVAAVAGSGAMAMTLMACYGLPPCQESVDKDGDGFPVCTDGGMLNGPEDCDDDNPNIHPGAIDPPGDGIDQDCSGEGGHGGGGAGGNGGAGGKGGAGGAGGAGGGGGAGGK